MEVIFYEILIINNKYEENRKKKWNKCKKCLHQFYFLILVSASKKHESRTIENESLEGRLCRRYNARHFSPAASLLQLSLLSHVGDSAPVNTINVSGTGDAYAVPDVATFSFTVTDTEKTVADAQTKATAEANSALAVFVPQVSPIKTSRRRIIR